VRDDLRRDADEVRALLDDLESSRFKSPRERDVERQQRESQRRRWTGEFAWLLYAAAWWFNSIMTMVAGFAALLHPCHTDGAAAWWMYASCYITTGLMLAPVMVAMTGLRLPGD